MSVIKRVLGLIPKKSSREERTFYSELIKAVDSGGVSKSDITDATNSIYTTLDSLGSPVSVDGAIRVEFPQTPTGFTSNAAFTSVILEWDAPTYAGHDYTEIFRADTDDLAIAEDNGVWLRSYENIISDSVDSGTTHYYWIRFVNKIAVHGAFNSPAGTEGTTSIPVKQMITELKGRITSSELSQELATPISKIPTLESDINAIEGENYTLQINDATSRLTNLEGEVNTLSTVQQGTYTKAETDDKVSGILNYVGAGDFEKSDTESLTAEAIIQNALDNADEKQERRYNNATIVRNEEARKTEYESLANARQTLQTSLGSDIASVQVDANSAITKANSAQADANTALVKYGVKLDVNGYVTGFAQNNNGTTGSFYIRADEFAIIDPASNTNSTSLTAQQKADATPFAVSGGNTYIKNAYIKDLTSDNIAANAVTADKISVTELSAVSANMGSVVAYSANIADGAITDAKIANTIQSTNYSSGNSGWLIDKSGYAEFYNTVIRGTLDGATINGGVIRGATIIFTSQLRATEAGEPFYVYGVPASDSGHTSVSGVYANSWKYLYTDVFGFYSYNALPSGTDYPEHYATQQISIDFSGGGTKRAITVSCRGVNIALYTSTGTLVSTIFNYSSGKNYNWTVTQNGVTVSHDYWSDPDQSESGSGEERVSINISGTYTFNFSGHDNEKLKVRFGLLDLARSESYSLTASTSTG